MRFDIQFKAHQQCSILIFCSDFSSDCVTEGLFPLPTPLYTVEDISTAKKYSNEPMNMVLMCEDVFQLEACSKVEGRPLSIRHQRQILHCHHWSCIC